MSPEASQLALPVYLRDDTTLDNFLFAEHNGALREALQALVTTGAEPSLYLHGPAGSGRSHLLQAACHCMPTGEALYLPLEQLLELPPQEVLAGVESLSLVSLDNLDLVSGRADWEEALFHLLNRAREQQCRLLIGANAAPRQLVLNLPDLESRLSWGLVFQLEEPADDEKLHILQFRARQRGMVLSDEAAAFIMSRAGRALDQLVDLLAQLDRDSLVAQRQLTIPFIKQCLGW